MYRSGGGRINERDVPESQHTVFIRGLPGNMSTDEIREFFEKDFGACTFDLSKCPLTVPTFPLTENYLASRFEYDMFRDIRRYYGLGPLLLNKVTHSVPLSVGRGARCMSPLRVGPLRAIQTPNRVVRKSVHNPPAQHSHTSFPSFSSGGEVARSPRRKMRRIRSKKVSSFAANAFLSACSSAAPKKSTKEKPKRRRSGSAAASTMSPSLADQGRQPHSGS
ncbi:hypothetical protein niasHT_030997 [Heterodera trifolii]|uniref:RRM domain-containing protein n=1 Tax=Heterodera trifolii TaxID=157864 RepID=A0ABD2HRJ5_9BILA